MLKSPILIKTNQNTNPDNDLFLLDASSNDVTITLPDITCDGLYFRICRIDTNTANTVTVRSFNDIQTINGRPYITLNIESKVGIVSFGYIWYSV